MRVIDALTLAARLHDGQRDKAGEPYIAHCVRVMLRLPSDATDDEKIAALLHDTIEDVPGAIDTLGEAGVPIEAMGMILALTRIEGETYVEFLERLQSSSARRVKIADIEDNSDERRLARLNAADQKRLRAKYQNALVQLQQ